jgi:hypothetical protein
VLSSVCLDYFLIDFSAAHLIERDLSPVLLLCPFEPTPEEYSIIAQFPKVFIMVGDPRSLKDIVSAGLQGAERVVIMNISNTLDSSKDDFGDSATIMISHLIYNTMTVPHSKV